MDSESLGKQIRRIRKSQGLSIRQLAVKVPTSERTMGSWERGSDAVWDNVERIEAALGRRLDVGIPTSVSFEAAIERLRAADLAVAQAHEIVRQLADRHGNPQT